MSPGQVELVGDVGVDASYDGGLDPDAEADVGLGIDGVPSIVLDEVGVL